MANTICYTVTEYTLGFTYDIAGYLIYNNNHRWECEVYLITADGDALLYGVMCTNDAIGVLHFFNSPTSIINYFWIQQKYIFTNGQMRINVYRA